ncbi:MAG: type IX secretion system sortase PorU [Bacteroidales bacterium]|nr:type IX secretion system sortase PorU [Bacteroidales bacterium]
MSYVKHIIFFLIVVWFGLQDGNAQSNVLSKGSWHRISISQNGIYRIRYQDLVNSKVLETPVSVSQIALFGGPNGAIPLENIANETFDLQEIAILICNANNVPISSGEFGPGDYILFYGQSPDQGNWNASQKKYIHQTNVFTDVMSYFFTTDFDKEGERKRLKNKPNRANPTVFITHFKDYFRHEKDDINPFQSSQEWYGEKMDQTQRRHDINLNLPGFVIDSTVEFRARFVANDTGRVVISSNNNNNQTKNFVTRTKSGSGVLMTEIIDDFIWKFTTAPSLLSLEYTRTSSNSSSWMHLDYLEVHYRRQLSLSLGNTSPVQFRFIDFQTSEVGQFTISSANSSTQVWDISYPLEPQKIDVITSGNTFTFSDSLVGTPEFITFSDNNIRSITQFQPILNQNLHEKDSVEYVMVVHPDFLSEAERLAEFHRNRNLNVLVVTPHEVFNEFSYGRQDPMAIRRMMRHYRNKAIEQHSEVLPKYLLLFGSPSYDYRHRTRDTNFVLNYQFPAGLTENQSFSTDDFFGFLKDGTNGNTDSLQIGIGRFPARTLAQATALVDKTIAYATPHSRNFGDWRNVVTNLADDGATEPFVQTFEAIPESNPRSAYFKNDTNFRGITVEKIYLDAFPQEATPSGMRYPDAKEALRQRIERGTLILNYQGHSGPVSLADESIMTITDIQNFGNIDQFMVFFTASCSFAKYDDPNVTSAGEWSVLSPRGAAVAHIGATRVAYTNPNDVFNGVFNHFALMRHSNGNARSLGEIMKLSKNRMGNPHVLKQFVLLGDPAISLALPKYQVITDSINGNSVHDGNDTMRALDRASISGRIMDFDHNFLSDFTGEISITVYDKPTQMQTFGHGNSLGGYNPVIDFSVQKNILYRGRVPVINGEFRVEFMMQKEINYNYGFGKISYYAFSDSVDATGVFDSVVIGGFGENFELVADAPTVKLFLSDTNFRSGNIATSSPILLAQISDKYGINLGGGIGHNIRLVINDDYTRQIWLNDFFEYLPSNSNENLVQGEVRYPMFDLEPGRYNMKLRISNVFNISAEDTLDFVVVQSENPIIGKVYNYPNPLRDFTKFYFTHNAPKKIKRVEIDIFDVGGKWVVRLSQNINPEGFAIEPIEWDTRDARGNPVRQGLYMYKLRIVLEDGRVAEKTEKLVIGAN